MKNITDFMSKMEPINNQELSMPEESFFVIITIEETMYEGVEVLITDSNKTIRQLVFDIVNVFELPQTDSGGNPIQYLLAIDEGRDEPEIIEFEDENGNDQSLLDYNISNGCHLFLVKVPIAGGFPYFDGTYLPYPTRVRKDVLTPNKQKCQHKLEAANAIPNILQCPFFLFVSSLFSFIINKKTNGNKCNVAKNVFSSVFAPAEVKLNSHMQVQVYLHLYEETEKVKALAQESDKNAKRRDYIPLQCKLKKGDKVDVLLNIYGESLLMSNKKSVVWQGSFTKCSFDYFVPKNIDVEELSCVALLTVNDIPVGEMRFITRIVKAPRQLNPEIIAHKYNRVFISYSHLDESKVKFLHEGLELGAVPHFFDRKYLKAGDVFPQVIQDYINSADLFILCWSENASKSEYVQKERLQALERAFPQVKPEQAAKLRIYPMSIEPRAELPIDMKNNYHFGEL